MKDLSVVPASASSKSTSTAWLLTEFGINREKFVAITYTKEALTTKETAAREHLESAIQEAMKRFHNESMGLVADVELYPCPEDCVHCREAAIEAA